MPLLELQDVSITLEGKAIVQEANMQIFPRELVALCGPSGVGKSTLLQAIAHLLPDSAYETEPSHQSIGHKITSWLTGESAWNSSRPSAFKVRGKMLFCGQDLGESSASSWQRLRGVELGFMMQNAAENFDERKSVISHFVEAVHAHEPDAKVADISERALKLLYRMHFAYPERILKQYSYEFSQGMCQRLALALALILRPKLLLADEFTSALDLCTKLNVLSLIKELQEEMGFAMLFITHSVQEANFLSDRIYMLQGGRLSMQPQQRPEPARAASVSQIGARGGAHDQ